MGLFYIEYLIIDYPEEENGGGGGGVCVCVSTEGPVVIDTVHHCISH